MSGPLNYDHPLPDEIIADSQPILRQNSQYWFAALGKDHQITNNTQATASFEGRHTQVSLNDRADSNLAIPADGTNTFLWGSTRDLYWRSSNADQTVGVRMTTATPFSAAGAVTAVQANARFATNTNYQAAAVGFPSASGGWTFLPGGLLLQYGSISAPGSGTGAVTFPIQFSAAPYSLTIGISRASGSSSSQNFYVDTLTTSQFAYSTTSSGNNPVYWMAIGAAA